MEGHSRHSCICFLDYRSEGDEFLSEGPRESTIGKHSPSPPRGSCSTSPSTNTNTDSQSYCIILWAADLLVEAYRNVVFQGDPNRL